VANFLADGTVMMTLLLLLLVLLCCCCCRSTFYASQPGQIEGYIDYPFLEE
jgi:hypothetical protein